MSTQLTDHAVLNWTRSLLLLAILAAVLGLTGRTFYNVIDMVNRVSFSHRFYRRAFRLQNEWQQAVNAIGRITAHDAERLTGTTGTIAVAARQLRLLQRNQSTAIQLPDVGQAVIQQDRTANLAILLLYPREAPTEAPLRLVAVTRPENQP
ncbi:MAG: hypothetical protein PHQ27_01550 [Victivallales bacterium]|nr:hypothetical protein [Victivallales bacterium]